MTSDRVENAARIIYQCRHPEGDPIGGEFDGPSWAEIEMRDARATAEVLDQAGLLAPAPNPAPWWRVVGPDGGVWCETSSESEARQKSRPGDALQRLWETPPVNQWRTEREES